MALQILERIDDDMGWARYRANDTSTGHAVGVKISGEAMTDKGETACLNKARDKYDGKASSVQVTTSDF